MISIVIPMYNEAENVEDTLKKVNDVLSGLKEKYEIITINDGSSDKTLEILHNSKKKYKNLTIISYAPNKGPGNAFREGFAKAKGDIIITMDADLSFSPDYIPEMLNKMQDADVVIGSQHMKGAKMENIPAWRVFVSKVAIGLDRFVLGVPLSSLSSFFVAYRKEALNSVNFISHGFDAQCEILVKLYKKGYQIVEIPCTLKWSEKRKNRLSFKKLLKEVNKRFMLWSYLKKEFKSQQ